MCVVKLCSMYTMKRCLQIILMQDITHRTIVGNKCSAWRLVKIIICTWSRWLTEYNKYTVRTVTNYCLTYFGIYTVDGPLGVLDYRVYHRKSVSSSLCMISNNTHCYILYLYYIWHFQLTSNKLLIVICH